MEKRNPEWKDPWDPVFLEAVRQVRAASERSAGDVGGAEQASRCSEEAQRWAAGRTGVGQRLVKALYRREGVKVVPETVGGPEVAEWRLDVPPGILPYGVQHNAAGVDDNDLRRSAKQSDLAPAG